MTRSSENRWESKRAHRLRSDFFLRTPFPVSQSSRFLFTYIPLLLLEINDYASRSSCSDREGCVSIGSLLHKSSWMTVVVFDGGRVALSFGRQKINLHEEGKEFEPKAMRPTSGSADLCFISDASIDSVTSTLASQGIEIVEGPVSKTGLRSHPFHLFQRSRWQPH